MSSNSRPEPGRRLAGGLTVAGVVLAFAAVGAYQRATAPARDSASAQDAAARLAALPTTLDGWAGTDTVVDPKQLKVAEAQAHLSRVYTKDGRSVAVLVLYGEPGPLGAHTPDVCYGASGHEPIGRPFRADVPGGFGSLWTTQFAAPGTPPSVVEVTWGWGDDGTWAASDSPRVEFAGRAAIYKLYISRLLPDGSAGDPPANEFVGPLLAGLKACLTAPTPDRR